MPRTKSASHEPAAAPSAAFEVTRALRDALPAEQITPPPQELRPMLDGARSLASALADPAVVDRFARLPKDLFDPASLARFSDAIAAFEHARAELDAAVNARGEVTLPEELAARAHGLRQRMMKVVIHYFEDDDALAADVRALGRRRGHGALVADLRRLAEIYDAQRAVVERDPKYWREGDSDAAREAADAVTVLLDEARGEAERAWGDAVRRSWSLLAALHEDLRLTAGWLFRSEGGASRFPAMPPAPRRRGPRARVAGEGAA